MYLANVAPAAAAIGGTGTVAKLFPLVSNSAQPAALAAFGSGRLEGRQFYVRAGGKLFVNGTTPTVITSLYGIVGGVPAANPLVAASYTSLASQSAQTLTTASAYPWLIEAILQGDSTSGKLQGMFRVSVNNVPTAWAALSAQLTGVNLATQQALVNGLPVTSDEPSITFVAGVTFGVSDALNTANLLQFDLEQ